MNQFRDQELHSSFLELSRFTITLLDNKITDQVAELFHELRENGFRKIIKKHYEEILASQQYKKFETLLTNNEKYAKNFKTPVGTNDALFNRTINDLIESIFVDYLMNHHLNFEEDIINQYYEKLEKFLIDEQIIVHVTTPIIGLVKDQTKLQIEDEISIVYSNKQGKLVFQGNTDIIKHAYANFDLKLEFITNKIYEKIPDEEKNNSISRKARIIIQNLMIVLRLHHSGKIGFLDSNLVDTLFSGGQVWQNPRCGLPQYWELWNKPPYVLTADDIEEIKKLREEILKVVSRNQNEEVARAIDRFMTSYEQDLIEDRILDLIISLESLLQNEVDELRYRLSIRTAKFLGKDAQDRNKIYKTILAGYNVRNKTAHGKDIPKVTIGDEEITLEELANRIENHVRDAIKLLIKKLNNGETRKKIIEKLDDELFLEDLQDTIE